AGFCALVTFPPVPSAVAARLSLRARLRNGEEQSHDLGEVLLRPAGPPPPEGHGPAGDLVAVCMATYNPPADLFRRQVESIRAQTHRNWVCVINDDGSDPAALALVRDAVAADDRFQVQSNPARLGFYRNFEKCLSRVPAGAAFVALSDQDDYWYPDKLEVLLRQFDAGTTLAYADVRVVDREGRVRAETYWTTRRNNYTNFATLLLANTVTGAASLFRRDLLDDLLPFPQDLRGSFHDHWIACTALALGTIRYVDRPLHDYVQHGSNIIGHYAPGSAGVLGLLRKYSWRCFWPPAVLGLLLNAGRVGYEFFYLRLRLIALTLRLRCGGRLEPAKERTLERLGAADDSLAAQLWLAARGVVRAGRGSDTLGAESVMLRAFLWRHAMRLRAWLHRLRARRRPR
ncbi:MAG TPA: glycosyltransferase family 2 protein, partial [Gemmataceae bacterium]|nr:glycosyltransferase family 2 protein [Gemmataceae bacterium]